MGVRVSVAVFEIVGEKVFVAVAVFVLVKDGLFVRVTVLVSVFVIAAEGLFGGEDGSGLDTSLGVKVQEQIRHTRNKI